MLGVGLLAVRLIVDCKGFLGSSGHFGKFGLAGYA